MYCTNCGEEVGDAQSISFCTNCGAAVGQQEADSVESSTPSDQDSSAKTQPTTQDPEPVTTEQPSSQTLGDRVVAFGVTRIITLVSGGLVLISMFLPWVTAVGGRQFSANATETEFGTPVLIAGGALFVLSAVRWGRGIGWVTMLLSGLAGAGTAYIGLGAQQTLSVTRSFGYVLVRGNEVPIAGVEPGVGATVALVAGGLAVAGSLGGIIGSFTGGLSQID